MKRTYTVRMTLSKLIKLAQKAIAEHGDMPVTVDAWASEVGYLDRVDEAEVMEVGNHYYYAYKGKSFMVEGKGVKVFNIRSNQ